MCIALLSTAHPLYPLILLNNRDEYLSRPTAPAQWWPPPHDQTLAGRDLLRSIQGTWLGITRKGKIGVLTNYREDVTPSPTAVSRGAIIRKWLTDDDEHDTAKFVTEVVNTGVARDAGGFSLVCGNVGERLAVISNRAGDEGEVPWICGDVVQTVGLSNTTFTDRSWRKVREGEDLMLKTIREAIRDEVGEDELIRRFLTILGRDTLERTVQGGGLDVYVKQLRNTILVPALGRKKSVDGLPADEIATSRKSETVEVIPVEGKAKTEENVGMSGLYGTQKHTVVLVDKEMNVRFFEKTLFDQNSNPVPDGEGIVDVRFGIER